MRILIVVVLAAALGWSAWWWIGAGTLERSLEDWFAQRRDEGWVADYAEIGVSGFPNRFDTTIDAVTLADPETGIAYDLPFFQILALSYKPYHVIAVFPHDWTLATPLGRSRILSTRMRGSVVFEPSPALALDRTTVVVDELAVEMPEGTARARQMRFATRRTASENAYEIGLELLDFAPPEDTVSELDPTGHLPPRIEGLHLDATIAFDAPWDRSAIEEARPQPTAIDLTDLRATWGDLHLRAAGTLDIDASGTPEGRITIKAENWREMLAIARASGSVPEALAPTIERALEVLAGLSGSRETIDVPLTFSGGRVSFGPVPLGRAPILHLR